MHTARLPPPPPPPVAAVGHPPPLEQQPLGVPVAPLVGGQQQPRLAGYFGIEPVGTICPHCHADIVTTIEAHPGLLSWCACAALCLIGAWPCAPIPLLVKQCRDVAHYCPACGVHIRTRAAVL